MRHHILSRPGLPPHHVLAVAAFCSLCLPLAAEPPRGPDARPASFERAAPTETARTVTFARRTQQVGDQLEQTLGIELQLDSMIRQGNQVVEQAKTAVHRHQRRVVTTTDVAGGMPVAVLVRYLEATKRLAAGTVAADLEKTASTPQPVQGKAYRCRREGDELQVTDEQGNLPPLDEFEIVAQNMETLGQANPLAKFLAGRTFTVGQRIALPHDVAEKLLGLGDDMGEVERFDLTLRDVRTVDGATCAVFDASVEAASSDASQMRLAVDGPLVIQVDSCRAVQAHFTGPIGMSDTRGSLSETYQMTGTGKMTVRIGSTYLDVAR